MKATESLLDRYALFSSLAGSREVRDFRLARFGILVGVLLIALMGAAELLFFGSLLLQLLR